MLTAVRYWCLLCVVCCSQARQRNMTLELKEDNKLRVYKVRQVAGRCSGDTQGQGAACTAARSFLVLLARAVQLWRMLGTSHHATAVAIRPGYC